MDTFVSAASIRFEIWGSWVRVKQISIFPGIFLENSDFFRQFHKKYDFTGNNWLFTATSGQIILFLFKSGFQTYFLHMIRYNNISRPVHDSPRPRHDPTNPLRPPRPPCPKSGGRDPNAPGLASLLCVHRIDSIARCSSEYEGCVHFQTSHR